jgi:DnaJ domain
MNNKDSKGYYKILGVHPDAPASVIKAAYRAIAMDLHPDRNQQKDTTSQFQKIQAAYAVLSDQEKRKSYDADSSIPHSETEQTSGGSYKPLEPIVCSKCSAVTAQPRYKVFYSVYGYLIGATRKPHQGIFCSKCEIRVALQSSGTTLVTGWWSIYGFIWTLQALFQNLIGGQFHLQNAQLQGYQAIYFAKMGKVNLARATAAEALKMAEKANKKNDPVALFELKKNLIDFLNSFPSDNKVVELKSTDGFLNKRFVYQLLLLLAFASLIFGKSYQLEMAEAETERARLEQEGIDRKNAAAIVAKKAEILKSMEMPLPENGIFSLVGRSNYNPNNSPALKVTNSPGANTLMKLNRASDGAEVMSIFIRAGQVIEVPIPVGIYAVKIASGQTWYGDKVRFGPATSYAKLDAIFDFKIEGNRLLGHELTLTRVKHGNLSQSPLTASSF